MSSAVEGGCVELIREIGLEDGSQLLQVIRSVAPDCASMCADAVGLHLREVLQQSRTVDVFRYWRVAGWSAALTLAAGRGVGGVECPRVHLDGLSPAMQVWGAGFICESEWAEGFAEAALPVLFEATAPRPWEASAALAVAGVRGHKIVIAPRDSEAWRDALVGASFGQLLAVHRFLGEGRDGTGLLRAARPGIEQKLASPIARASLDAAELGVVLTDHRTAE